MLLAALYLKIITQLPLLRCTRSFWQPCINGNHVWKLRAVCGCRRRNKFLFITTRSCQVIFFCFLFLFLVLIPVSGCLNYSGRLTFLLSAERQATCAGALQVPGLMVLEILTSFITVFSWEMELAGFSFFNLKRQMCKFQ